MDLWASLKRTNRQGVVITSVLKNTIIEVFKQQKNIDISDQILSLKYTMHSITIVTEKPIVNAEIVLLEADIKKSFLTKLERMGIPLEDVRLRYR